MAERDQSGEQPKPPPKRDHLFKKGVSGNPGGRPKGISARIRDLTNDFDSVIGFWLAAVRGDFPTARFADRVRCSELLIERGAGKVPDVSVTLGEGVDPSVTLTGEDLEALARVARLGLLAKPADVVDAELVPEADPQAVSQAVSVPSSSPNVAPSLDLSSDDTRLDD